MATTQEPLQHNHPQHEDGGHHAPPRSTLWERITNNRFLFISIIVHLVFGLAAAAWVVQTISAKRKLTFTAAPPSPNPSTRSLEHKVQMAKKQNTMSAPVQSKRVTTTGLAKVSLPDMPAMPAANTMAAPGRMPGMGGTGAGLGPSVAMASGTGSSGGPVPFFGFRGSGAGLAGTFYDLKQNKDGKPSDMALQPFEQGGKFVINAPVNKIYDRTLSSVVSGGMSENSLNKYFQGPQPLYLTQLYVPAIAADQAPKAFNLSVKGRRWVIVYRGKITPPESGRFRFAGWGDDILVVRLNGHIVLDASLVPPTKFSQKERYAHSGMPTGWATVVGEWFEARAGTAYQMELLIGERPGGEYSGYLLLEKEGIEYQKDAAGAPRLPIFKLAPSAMPKRGNVVPEAAADASWSVWKAQSQQRMPGGI